VRIGNYFIDDLLMAHVWRDHRFKNEGLFYRFFDDDRISSQITDKSWHDVLPEIDGKELVSEKDYHDNLQGKTDMLEKSEHIPPMLFDKHNCDMLDQCRPRYWNDPPESDNNQYDLIAIGAGAGGLTAAGGSSYGGAKSAMIEKAYMGGDCLVTGCVPSKAFIKAASVAATVKKASEFGVEIEEEVKVNFGKVMEKMREIRAHISEADAAESFSKTYGVDIFLGHARFINRNELTVNGRVLRFKKCVIASGGSPMVPQDIKGLKDIQYYTSENVFNMTKQPKSLFIIGSGPIGSELGQSF